MNRHRPDDIDPVTLLTVVEATAHKPIPGRRTIMKHRITALLITLAALALVVGGTLHTTQAKTDPQASVCYWVISFVLYPHQVWYCTSGGGGSW